MLVINHMICPSCGHDFFIQANYATCPACWCFFYTSQSLTRGRDWGVVNSNVSYWIVGPQEVPA